jgi:hypothetical protein
MREIRQSGSVRGVRSNPYPYRDCGLEFPRIPGQRATWKARNL